MGEEIMQTREKALAALIFAGVAFSPVSQASDTNDWTFEITPYLFAAAMDGDIGVKGHTTDLDASFSDIAENLKAGFMGLFTAHKGPWTLSFEGVYMKLGADGQTSITGPGGIVSIGGEQDVSTYMYVYQGSVGYRLIDDATKLDLVGGIRYTKLRTEIDIDVAFNPPPFSGRREVKGSDSWTDAVIGVRVEHPVARNVSLLGYFDVGGGGSDLTYQVIAGVNWEFKEGFTAKAGYRYLYWDYEDDGAVWDVAASGPYLGLGFRF